jgi:DNA-binding NarL/FixJ family response regulator
LALRVVLAEDEEMIRRGLKLCLEQEGIRVVAEAANGLHALKLIGQHDPEVAVLDQMMPSLTGIEVAREVFRQHRSTRTIILTARMDRQLAVEALRAGASGFVLKGQSIEDLVGAVQKVARGERYLCPSLGGDLVMDLVHSSHSSAGALSGRERQVLQLIAQGYSTKGAADALGISVKTADTHRTRVMKKLDLHATADLVRYAIRHGIIGP